MGYREIQLFGQKFFSGTRQEALSFIDSLVQGKRAKIIAAVNVFLITECQKNKKLSKFYNQCDLITVDGRPLVFVSRLLSKFPFPEMVGGPHLWTELLIHASQREFPFYFLGSTDQILMKARKRLEATIPNLKVAGIHNGFFDLNSREFQEIIGEINDLHPTFIYIGMPTPLKEIVAERLKKELQDGVVVLIGGAFDYFAGEKKIEKEWVSKLCLGWFFRMMQEPDRLFTRYIKSNNKFFFLMIKELINKINK